ncbi:ferric reductase-like transmembrane domain-containing protein [Roseobacter sinensis]|uniref:Ferric reductase-like transmembrane domain-containing protein n=1 Tax=Roseobacter sinensis TaxID=2931391 RepID=A0ABT3BGU8_9RHOB|nr:ferric reductase-like transmembrane domain-containing protein [Roseobacter sp. WL0113]MCV3272801.1 ferric reductase-like transmembrane domain-containing protein [Roseobacter sp. WL0113]
MAAVDRHRVRTGLIWATLAGAMLSPVGLAAASPLLAWRDPVYVTGGFAGILAMSLLLLQPLLATGVLPGLSQAGARRVHRWVGGSLVGAVVVHVAALWITSPPDMIDALLLASPTPFSIWGVIAMWAVFAAATLAALRRRLRLRPTTWRAAHRTLATAVVITAVLHTMLIEGTMETLSKAALCALVIGAMAAALLTIRSRKRRAPQKRRPETTVPTEDAGG